MFAHSRRLWISALLWISPLASLSCRKPATPPDPSSSTSRLAPFPSPLPDFGQLPHFSLIDQTGRTFARQDLKAGIWVLDFIFTRCTTVCPRLSQEMKALQTLSPSNLISFLSISIDPDYDTVDRLASYAKRYQADPARWRFLTGDKRMIRALQLKTQRHLDPDEITAHSKQLYLLDQDGFIREVYSIPQSSALQPGRREELLADARRLLANPARPEPAQP